MTKVTGFFTQLMRKYLPDPFVFAILLTLLTALLAIVVERSNPIDIVASWGDGFWNLLAFTTQMAVILAMGYVLAVAPVTDRLLDRLADKVRTPRGAVIVATLVGAIGSYLNWGFGLVVGGIIAKKLAYRVRGVHYPTIIASAYSGFTLYGLGLSATIPLTISTAGHALEGSMGLIPVAETLFHPIMLVTALVVLITLPLLNAWLHPKPGADIVEIDRDRFRGEMEQPRISHRDELAKLREADGGTLTFANKLNHSRVIAYVIGALGIGWSIQHLLTGGAADLNFINFLILFLGIILVGTPQRYVEKLAGGIGTVSGIILQFPFYAGIMAIMEGSGLVETIAAWFASFSTAETLPFWGYVASFVINFFAPSGGGHWVLQGPFMIDAANQLGSNMAATAVSVQLGNAWNDLVQPFWILPALAISKLKLKDIMGHTVVCMFWVGIVYGAAMLLWGFIG